MGTRTENLKHKIFGDRRDQRIAIRDAGFTDEDHASAWAHEALRQAQVSPGHELQAIAALRRQRPDLTLSTARYILHRAQLRSGD
ncbi:hypothetical protein [Nesterenkonia sp. CF4.4]|uniref:hypothetical protein n=1 Tax=Nesterenkonia sp. CF4.4 TaxID=3373079 RepID=UPI003EE55447